MTAQDLSSAKISPVRYAHEQLVKIRGEIVADPWCKATEHGSRWAYYARTCRCQAARDDCALYERRRSKRKLLGRPLTLPALGTLRRLQALNALGWTMLAIADEGGLDRKYLGHIVGQAPRTVFRGTAERVAAVYERLSGTPGPSNRARLCAARKGWAPPLAWDDGAIDDPRARPTGLAGADARIFWDELRWQEVDMLKRLGHEHKVIAARMGVDVKAFERAQRRRRAAA